MFVTLRITFSGLCLFVSSSDGANMHVLLPKTERMQHDHPNEGEPHELHSPNEPAAGPPMTVTAMPAHVAHWIYDEGYIGGTPSNGIFTHRPWLGGVLDLSGLQAADPIQLPINHDGVANISRLLGPRVPARLFSQGGDATGAFGRVTFASGSLEATKCGAEWRMGSEIVRMATKATWTIRHIMNWPTAVWGSAGLGRLVPVMNAEYGEGLVDLHLFHVPADQMPPTPTSPMPHTPSTLGSHPAHFSGFNALLEPALAESQFPTLYALDTCSAGVGAEDFRIRGVDPYSCMVVGGDPCHPCP